MERVERGVQGGNVRSCVAGIAALRGRTSTIVLCLVWLCRADLRGWKAWGLVVVLAVAAELAQDLAPGRSPRVDDVLLNLAGGMVGLLLGRGGSLARARKGTG